MKLLTNDQKGMLIVVCILASGGELTAAKRGLKKQMHITQQDVTRALRAPLEFHAERKMVDVSADLVEGLDLKETFETIINTAKERGTVDKLPQAILVCHKELCSGNTKLPVDAFESAASYIVDKIATDVRSVGSGRAGTRGNLLDGRRFHSPSLGLDNDNFQISRLLCCLKRNVSSLRHDLNECCEELKQDFRQTWELLEEIDMDLQDCCCELKQDLHECCDDIKEDFRTTWKKLGEDDCLVPCGHLPDFVYCKDCEWDINSCDISKDCAFDEINGHKGSMFEWLKMIYILTRNINNKLIGPTFKSDCSWVEPGVQKTSGSVDWC